MGRYRTPLPDIVELASTNAMLRQEFSDGRTVDILLIAEPGTITGWLVTDIAPPRPSHEPRYGL
ncbi:hypothetical protein G7085_20890 [Tessaracoccus sp. HDW20]|uniref:hypothetical protein n=1 Tax=Tessaracoccus coleopterorum TaxID=2714950 RepID=UPI0018D28A65|nr:hypothetical protein [Tessaracoccus coleopterorum]NHB86140.1 hypothetical protein [Tessaracoccus coleopterorum]